MRENKSSFHSRYLSTACDLPLGTQDWTSTARWPKRSILLIRVSERESAAGRRKSARWRREMMPAKSGRRHWPSANIRFASSRSRFIRVPKRVEPLQLRSSECQVALGKSGNVFHFCGQSVLAFGRRAGSGRK